MAFCFNIVFRLLYLIYLNKKTTTFIIKRFFHSNSFKLFYKIDVNH